MLKTQRVVPPDLGRNESILEFRCPRVQEIPGRQARARPCPRVSQPPLVVATVAEDSILGQPRAGARGRPVSAPALASRGERGRRCVTPRQTCPRPGGLRRNLRSKTRWFTGFCNSHQVSHFATFFIDCESRDIRCRESFRLSPEEGAPPTPRLRGRAPSTQFPWRFSRRGSFASRAGADASLHGSRGHEGRVPPEPSLSCHGFAGRSARQVQWTSRDVAGGEPPTSPRSEHFTGPFNRSPLGSLGRGRIIFAHFPVAGLGVAAAWELHGSLQCIWLIGRFVPAPIAAGGLGAGLPLVSRQLSHL
uniref:Uncharacterized protein n=1 Tax=Populus alba TaxID=43335 RepID=A0A4U5PN59_POPAL|nr:hypothetical protein D5086_0000205260 [Populus alba]